MCSSSAALDSQAFSGQLGWNITQIFNEQFQSKRNITFYQIICDLKNRLHEVASYSNYQFAVDFLEHDMDIDDVIFPSKFIKSPVMTPVNVSADSTPNTSKMDKLQKLTKITISKTSSFRATKSPNPQNGQNPKSPLLSPWNSRSPRERLSALKKSTSFSFKSLKNRKNKPLNDLNLKVNSKGNSNGNLNQNYPSSPVSHSVVSLHSVTHSNSHQYSHSTQFSQSGSSSFSPMSPSPLNPQYPAVNALNGWNGVNGLQILNPFSFIEPLSLTKSSRIQQIHDIKLMTVEQPVVLDYEGMDGWGQRMVILSRNKNKTKVLMEWTFTMSGEPYTVGLLHSQKRNPNLKAAVKLIVNGREMYAQKATATQFYVQPQDDLVLGISIMLDEVEGFLYSMEVNGKQHETYFDEWRAVQNMQMLLR